MCHKQLPSVPVLKLPVPVVPAAAVVSGGAGPGALQSRKPLLLTDPTQRLRGWGSSAGEMGHRTPTAEMTEKWVLLLLTVEKMYQKLKLM